MFAFLQAPENIAFVTAIVLMLLIGAVQLVGMGGDWDVDADPAVDGALLSWLGVGHLPLLLLLVVYLAIFGLGGLILQQLVHDLTGDLLTPWAAVPLAGIAGLPLTGLAARGLARVLPRDESSALPIEVLIGREARIVTGRATPGNPARARAEDPHGQVHYVMVEPDTDGQAFQEGERVLLVRREGHGFRAVARGDFYVPRLEP